jgi:hypothetical protein
MKNTILALTLIWFGFPAVVHSQTISVADSLEITQKIDDWNRGWKEKEYKLATKWYSEQAEFTNAFGHNRVGIAEIEELLEEVFQLPFVMAGDSEMAGQKMIPISENVILVVTNIERAGQETPDGVQIATRQTTHHRLFVKESEWLIAGHLISDARDRETENH